VAKDGAAIYKPSRHVELIRDSFEWQGKDPEAFVGFPVRRPEALRRASHVEWIDTDHWRVPSDIVDRGAAHDLGRGGDSRQVRMLSTLDLQQQVTSDGAARLDRELVTSARTPLIKSGFGREVAWALDRCAERLVETGLASREPDGAFGLPRNLVTPLERQEVDRSETKWPWRATAHSRQSRPASMSAEHSFGSANLASGRYAMIDDRLGFSLVPWQQVLDRRIGQHIAGIVRETGIEWTFGRKRGLGL
jgi:hypothetical protein